MNSSSSRQARAAAEYNTVVIDAVYISIQVSVMEISFSRTLSVFYDKMAQSG